MRSIVLAWLLAVGGYGCCHDEQRVQTTRAEGPPALPAEAAAEDCCSYFEPFLRADPQDCSGQSCQVIWCSGAGVIGSECSPPHALEVQPTVSGSDALVWVGFGDSPAAEVRISFRYSQWEGYPPVPDLASAWLEVLPGPENGFDPDQCPTLGYQEALQLNRTWSGTIQCFDECYVHYPAEGDNGVCFRFRKKGTYGKTPVLAVDDIRIEVVRSE